MSFLDREKLLMSANSTLSFGVNVVDHILKGVKRELKKMEIEGNLKHLQTSSKVTTDPEEEFHFPSKQHLSSNGPFSMAPSSSPLQCASSSHHHYRASRKRQSSSPIIVTTSLGKSIAIPDMENLLLPLKRPYSGGSDEENTDFSTRMLYLERIEE